MAEQPERVYSLLVREGPLHRRLDELVYLIPEIAEQLEELIISNALRDEPSVRTCPVSEFTAAVLTETMFDRAVSVETGQLAALALSLMEEFSEQYLTTLHGMVIGASDIERSLDTSPHMRATALRALAAIWKEKGVLAFTLQQKDEFGQTLLHHAAENGFAGVVNELVAAGANIDDLDNNGRTPLILSSIAGQTEVVQALMELGADPSKKDSMGLNCLMHAAIHGRQSTIRAFGPYVIKKTKGEGSTSTTGLNPDEHSKDGKTALMLCCLHGKTQCVEPLLAIGASIDAGDVNHRSALLIACENQQDAVVGVLLQFGADIHRKDKQGMTALMIAAESGDIRIVRSLLLMMERQFAKNADVEFGIDEQAPGRHNMTALMIASALGYDQVVYELLESGADPLINTDRMPRVQKQGKTALDLAVLANQTKVIELLRARVQEATEAQAKIDSGDRSMIDEELLATKVGEDIFVTHLHVTGEAIDSSVSEQQRRSELDRKLFDEEAFFMFTPHLTFNTQQSLTA